MTKICLIVAVLAYSAETGRPSHEKAEDKARTVPGQHREEGPGDPHATGQ
jgi:hypothetical protein